VITIIDNDNREWADAADLDNAIFAMKHISDEEDYLELRAVDEDGKVLAWCFADGMGHLIQTSRKCHVD